VVKESANGRSTEVSRLIKATRRDIFQAFLDANSMASWLPPESMRGEVHAFDAREGGVFRMSLVYEGEHPVPGKTSADTDTFQGRFVQLIPCERIVQAVEFDSNDPELAGEMTITWTLEDRSEGTEVGVLCENIPLGVRIEDNETGSRSTLKKLAAFVERSTL
jgi:uncharacterized protein YndB with AHSA1/START domain